MDLVLRRLQDLHLVAQCKQPQIHVWTFQPLATRLWWRLRAQRGLPLLPQACDFLGEQGKIEMGIGWVPSKTPGYVSSATPSDYVAEIERLRAVLTLFVRCAYPVSKELNPRGHSWMPEKNLDYALEEAKAALTVGHQQTAKGS